MLGAFRELLQSGGGFGGGDRISEVGLQAFELLLEARESLLDCRCGCAGGEGPAGEQEESETEAVGG